MSGARSRATTGRGRLVVAVLALTMSIPAFGTVVPGVTGSGLGMVDAVLTTPSPPSRSGSGPGPYFRRPVDTVSKAALGDK